MTLLATIVGRVASGRSYHSAPRTEATVDEPLKERRDALDIGSYRLYTLDRRAGFRLIRRLAITAGIRKLASPHSLRHTFCTFALDAGVPLRDAAMRHSDPRTTMRYGRARLTLERAATYRLTGYLDWPD